jgi:hypothetical protein
VDSQFQKTSVILTAQKGVWATDPSRGKQVPEGYVVDARDFDFVNGVVISRPGISQKDISSIGGTSTLLHSVGFRLYDATHLSWSSDVNYVSANLLCYDDKYEFLTYNPFADTFTNTPITGLTFTLASIFDGCFALVNGVLVVGGFKSAGDTGLHVIDYIANTATEVVGEEWYFCVGHKSRLFVAKQIGTGYSGLQTVGWTVPGTVNDFTNFGSGTAILPDNPDIVHRLGVIRDTIVITRGGSIVLAELTGQGSNPYNFRTVFPFGSGAPRHIPSIASDSESMFWVGDDNVYMYDIAKLTPIGDAVMKHMMDYALEGLETVNLRGTIINASPIRRRRQYVLSPTHLPSGDTTFNVYIYDLATGTWSIHTYNQRVRGGVWALDAGGGFYNYGTMPAYVSETEVMSVMRKTLECENSPYLVFPTLQIGRAKNDYRMMRAWLDCSVVGAGGTVYLRVQGVEGRYNLAVDYTYSAAAMAQNEDGIGQRLVFDLDENACVGNNFVLTLTFPTGCRCVFTRLEVDYAEAGELR